MFWGLRIEDWGLGIEDWGLVVIGTRRWEWVSSKNSITTNTNQNQNTNQITKNTKHKTCLNPELHFIENITNGQASKLFYIIIFHLCLNQQTLKKKKKKKKAPIHSTLHIIISVPQASSMKNTLGTTISTRRGWGSRWVVIESIAILSSKKTRGRRSELYNIQVIRSSRPSHEWRIPTTIQFFACFFCTNQFTPTRTFHSVRWITDSCWMQIHVCDYCCHVFGDGQWISTNIRHKPKEWGALGFKYPSARYSGGATQYSIQFRSNSKPISAILHHHKLIPNDTCFLFFNGFSEGDSCQSNTIKCINHPSQQNWQLQLIEQPDSRPTNCTQYTPHHTVQHSTNQMSHHTAVAPHRWTTSHGYLSGLSLASSLDVLIGAP